MRITFENYIIEPLEITDAKAFFELIINNKKRLETFFAGTVGSTKTLSDTENYCQEMMMNREQKSYFPYIIKSIDTKEFIGLVDVKNIDWQIPKAELGYFIDSNFEGKGVVTKSVHHVIQYLINEFQFQKLFCRVNAENLGSIQIALKNDFELEGTIRRDYRTSSGEVVDLNYYGRLF